MNREVTKNVEDKRVSDPIGKAFRTSMENGRVMPIISNRVIVNRMLGGYEQFLSGYAKHVSYPEEMGHVNSLVTLAKYHKHKPRKDGSFLGDEDLKYDYLDYVKNILYKRYEQSNPGSKKLEEAKIQKEKRTVSDFSGHLGYTQFAGAKDPLLLLANKPFKFVITTSPFTFIEDAFRLAGKEPLTEVFRWTDRLQRTIDSAINDDYEAKVSEPLIFHIHGLDKYPETLVLTEDDHLDFLVNVIQHKGNNSVDFVPAILAGAFQYNLLVLGFHLGSWAFRGLYTGFIKYDAQADERGVCVVLTDTQLERAYLEDYLRREAKFRVCWDSLEEFACKEL